jgi:hypothetical protein
MNGASSFDFAAYKSSRNGLSPLLESFNESDKSEATSPIKDLAVRSSYPLFRSTVPVSATLAGGGVGLSNALISGRQKHSDLDNLMGQFNNLMTQLKVPPSTKNTSEPVFTANQDYIHLETLRNSQEFLDSSSRLFNDNGAFHVSDANTDRTDTDDHSADDSASAAVAAIRQLSVRQGNASSTAETGALQSEITAQMMRIYTNNNKRDSSPTSSTNGSTPSSPDRRDSQSKNDSYPNIYNSSHAPAASAESERFLGYGPKIVESPLRTAGRHLRKTSQDIENRNNFGSEHDSVTAESFIGNQWAGNIQTNLNGQTFPHYFNARHEDEMRQRIEAEERTYEREYSNDRHHAVEREREKDRERDRERGSETGNAVQKHQQYPHTIGSCSSADRQNEFENNPVRTADNLYEHYPIRTSVITYVPVGTTHRTKLASMMTEGTDGDCVRTSPSRSLIHDDGTVGRNEPYVQHEEEHEREYDHHQGETQNSYQNSNQNNGQNNRQNNGQSNGQSNGQNNGQNKSHVQNLIQDPHLNSRSYKSSTYDQPPQYIQHPPLTHSARTQDSEKRYGHQHGQSGQQYEHEYDQRIGHQYDHESEEEQGREEEERGMQRTCDASNKSHSTSSGESSYSTSPHPSSGRAFGPQTVPPKVGSESLNNPPSSYSLTDDADRWRSTGRGNETREYSAGDRYGLQGREGSRERGSDRGRDLSDRRSYVKNVNDDYRVTYRTNREDEGSRNISKNGMIDEDKAEVKISKTTKYDDYGEGSEGRQREVGGGLEEDDTVPPAPPSYLEDFNRLQVG